jgi:crossover junction endodeoxyribonuclease RuvC
MTPSAFLGVDCGLSGALAVLEAGTVRLHDVPTRKATRGHVYLPADMAALLEPYAGRAACVIEEASAPRLARDVGAGSGRSALKVGYGAGLWVGLLAAFRIAYEVVPPAEWKRAFRLVGQDKPASRARAQELFPDLRDELAKRRPDFAEALLLAEFARRRQAGGKP